MTTSLAYIHNIITMYVHTYFIVVMVSLQLNNATVPILDRADDIQAQVTKQDCAQKFLSSGLNKLHNTD